MSSIHKITKAKARKLMVSAQGLDGSWKLKKGTAGALQIIEKLGYVQIDTISVVQRAHHHIFWSRCEDYRPDFLDTMLRDERSVFEYWTHAASYIPMSDFRFYLRRMKHQEKDENSWFMGKDLHEVLESVYKRIQKEGPLRSADFKQDRKRGSWWDWKPEKRALEVLLDRGKLMIHERRGFQRVYDLTERVLPETVDTTFPSREEVDRYALLCSVRTRGICNENDLGWGYIHSAGQSTVLTELVDEGLVLPVNISGEDGTWYTAPETLKQVSSKRKKRFHILSPFDSMIINRRKISRFFGFNCKLECYVPEKKRKYGYFCLPLLWGDEFIGRIDAKADRKKKELIIRKLMFEPGFSNADKLLPVLAEKLRAFMEFNECERISLEKVSPVKYKSALKKELKI